LSLALVERPCLLLEVHGSEAGVGETWQTATEVMRGAGGEPLVLPDGRDAWSIREHATRAIEAARPGAATRRADLAIPIGALPPRAGAGGRRGAGRGLAVLCAATRGAAILRAGGPAARGGRRGAGGAGAALVEPALGRGGAGPGEQGGGLANRRYAAREHGA